MKDKKAHHIKKDKFQLSESQLAFSMIAPALILILVIALYPVLRSFYFSLFDLRLNHPTKNALHLSYQIDMERYFNSNDLVGAALKTAVSETTGDTQAQLQKSLDDFNTANQSVESNPQVAKSEKSVRAYTDITQPVPDKIKFAEIDKATAENMIKTFDPMIKTLSKMNVDKDSKADVQKAGGLMQELRDSVVQPNFVGFKNYSYLANDNRFITSTLFTFLFTFLSVSCELVLGLLVAVLINKSFKGRGLVRTAVLVPWAIPTVVSALMWKFLYDGQNGFLAWLFTNLHLISNPGVLLTTHWGATFSIVFADVWKTTPYMALLLLAGLQGVDSSLYEASGVDGATKIQQFFKITLPLIKPTILVAVLFRTLDAFRIFDLVFVLTGGGNSTDTISTYAYQTMFAQMEFGKGSAVSVVVFLCVSVLSILYIKLLGTEVLTE